MPAALLMATAQAVLRSQLICGGRCSLQELISRLNVLIGQFTSVEEYLTAFVGLYEIDTGRLEFVNAGHPAGFVITRDKEVVRLEPADLVVGVIPDYDFKVFETTLNRDDVMILYSDGVTELFDPDEEQFGEERLLELLGKVRDRNLEDICGDLIAALDQFRRGHPRSDDITLLGLKRLS